MATTLIPLGDGDQLRDRLQSSNHEVIELESGNLDGSQYGYQIDPIVVPAGVGKHLFCQGEANIWCNNNGGNAAIMFDGKVNGGGARSFSVRNVKLRTNALRAWHLVNSQDNYFERMVGVGARECIVLENRNRDGFSEQNTLVSCKGAEARYSPLSFHRGTGGNASFRATTVTAFSGHLHRAEAISHPLYMGLGTHVYDSVLDGYGWMDDKENGKDRPFTQHGIKLLGNQKGTTLNWRLENGGLYLVHLNGHYSEQMASVMVAASWPYSMGIMIDLPANRTLEEVAPKIWNVTGAVPKSERLVGV